MFSGPCFFDLTKEQNKNIILSTTNGGMTMSNMKWLKSGFEFVVFGGTLATLVFWAEIVKSFTG